VAGRGTVMHAPGAFVARAGSGWWPGLTVARGRTVYPAGTSPSRTPQVGGRLLYL